jgi:hypothetical protein
MCWRCGSGTRGLGSRRNSWQKAGLGGAGKNSAAAARGKETFEKCGLPLCRQRRQKNRAWTERHFKARNVQRQQHKVTDETLKTWIENGDTLMPPSRKYWNRLKLRMSWYVKTL